MEDKKKKIIKASLDGIADLAPKMPKKPIKPKPVSKSSHKNNKK